VPAQQARAQEMSHTYTIPMHQAAHYGAPLQYTTAPVNLTQIPMQMPPQQMQQVYAPHYMPAQVVRPATTELTPGEIELLQQRHDLQTEILKFQAEEATRSAQTTHSAQLEQSAEEKGQGLAAAQEQVNAQQHKLETEVAELRSVLQSKHDHCLRLERELAEVRSNVPVTRSPATCEADAKKIDALQESIVRKDQQIRDLQATVARRQRTLTSSLESAVMKNRSFGRGSDYGPLFEGQPASAYRCVAQDDPVDLHMQEFYNSTSSCVPLKRINAGLYKFGKKQVSIKLTGSKLLACTEDDWNNGKYGSMMKFIASFENSERDRMGVENIDIPRRAFA